MASKLYPYQKKGVDLITKFGGRALLADDMGLGKSFQALYWFKEAKLTGPAIVVCPAFLKANWQHEALTHVGLMSEILEGTKPPPTSEGLFSEAPIYIINYEILMYWLRWIKKRRPQLTILDESQYIKSPGAKRTKATMGLCRGVPHVIALSGTPIENRPVEIWTTLNILSPERFRHWHRFVWRYCNPSRRPWGWDFSGSRREGELNDILKKTCMIRRRKSQVLKDLPRKSRYTVIMEIENRKEYEKATNDFLQWLSGKDIVRAQRAVRAEAMVKAGYLKRLAAELKINSVVQWIENFLVSTEGKLVVFTSHKKIINILHTNFNDISVKVDGSTKKNIRESEIKKFLNSKHTRLFFGNIRAAGIGINLIKSSTVAFAELDPTPGRLVQAEDRVHRIGQLHPVSIYYLIARDTIEERLCEILHRKQKTLDQILDGKSPQDPQGSVFNELIDTLLQDQSP